MITGDKKSGYSRVEVALKLKETISKKARDRQGARTDIVEIFPPSENGKTRDEIGSLAGVSGKTVDKVEYIQTHAPETAKKQSRTEKKKW